jgi:hypothetical protein
MDEAAALRDLRGIAPQLGAVVLMDSGGTTLGATVDEPGPLAQAVGDLLAGAAALRPGGDRAVERLHVATPAGSVFAVAAGGRTVAAVAPADAAPALVFHDLRGCLAALDPETADAQS